VAAVFLITSSAQAKKGSLNIMSDEIVMKGKILATHHYKEGNWTTTHYGFVVRYKKKLYECLVNRTEVYCWQPKPVNAVKTF